MKLSKNKTTATIQAVTVVSNNNNVNNLDNLEIFVFGLLSSQSVQTTIEYDTILTIEEVILSDLINKGINFFTNSNIGDFTELNKHIETLTLNITHTPPTETRGSRIVVRYDVSVESFVKVVLEATEEEIERLENIINNYKKVV